MIWVVSFVIAFLVLWAFTELFGKPPTGDEV